MILHYSHCHWYIRQRHDIRYVTWFEEVFDHLTSHYPYCHWYIKQRHVIWHIAWFWRTCICLIFIKKKYVTSNYPHYHWYVDGGKSYDTVLGLDGYLITWRHIILIVIGTLGRGMSCDTLLGFGGCLITWLVSSNGSGDNVTYYPPVEIRRNWATFSGRKDDMLWSSGNYTLKHVISLLVLHGWIYRLIPRMYHNFLITRMFNNRYEIRKKFVSLEKYVKMYLKNVSKYIDRS